MKKTARLRKIFAYTASFSLVATNFLGVLAPTTGPFKVEKVIANGNGLVVTKSVNKTDVWRDIPEDRLVEYSITVENTESCADAPLDVMLVMDRSGSMDDDTVWVPGYCVGHDGYDEYWCNYFGWTWIAGYWQNPIQPLSDSINSAKGFVDLLDDTKDYVGLVSYSTSATLDQGLTSNHSAVKTAIEAMVADGSTNIGAAIDIAHNEITAHGRQGSPDYASPVIILMTDGLANVGSPTPELYAENQALEAKAAGIRIITIGLGDEINGNWLRDNVATSPSDYYYAPTSSDLDSIYADIQATLVGNSIETVLTDDISDILVDADLWEASITNGGVFDGMDTITWDLGTLYCNVVDRLAVNGGMTNAATVRFSVIVHDDAPDGDIMDNMAVATNLGSSYAESNVVHTNIHALDKWDDVDPVAPGDVFTYTIQPSQEQAGNLMTQVKNGH